MKLHQFAFRSASALGIVFAASLARADVVFEATVNSLYVNRGVQVADLTWHPSVEFSRGDFYSGIWVAQPFENRGAPDFFSDEFDFYAGYGWALSAKTALDFGVTRHWVSGSDESTEIYVGLLGEFGTFAPAIYIYNDFDLDEFVVEATTTVVLPLEGFPFEATGRVGYLAGDSDYSFFGVDLIYPVELNDFARLSLGAHYSHNDVGAFVPDSNFYGSASISFGF